MVDSFWKPIPKKKKGKTNPFDLRLKPKKKDMDWPQAKRKYPNMNPMADTDGDGIKNKFDCRPLNKKKQGFMHAIKPVRKVRGGKKITANIKSWEKFQRYRPQVQRITERALKIQEEDYVKLHAKRDKIDAQRDPRQKKLMERRWKQDLDKRQQDDVGLFDYSTIPGIKGHPKTKWSMNNDNPFNLIVEKGIVKGEVYTKRRSPEVIEIKTTSVEPEYRGQGIGKRIVAAQFKQPGVKKVVGVSATASMGYWEKLGARKGNSPEEMEALREHRETSLRLAGIPNYEYESQPENFKRLNPEVQRIINESGSSFELSKEDFEKVAPTLYHGTTKERAKRIMKEGLKSNVKGRHKIRASGIYLTESKEWARGYSEPLSVEEDEGVLLRVRPTQEEFEKYSKLPSWKTGKAFGGGELSVGKDIPPERIEVVGPEEPRPEVLQDIDEIEEEIREYEEEED